MYDGTAERSDKYVDFGHRGNDFRKSFLRQINQLVSFNLIYDLAAPYYPANGRPSVDLVSMFKMLMVGYLYGIKSERRLIQEVQLNIVYRWFCGFRARREDTRSFYVQQNKSS